MPFFRKCISLPAFICGHSPSLFQIRSERIECFSKRIQWAENTDVCKLHAPPLSADLSVTTLCRCSDISISWSDLITLALGRNAPAKVGIICPVYVQLPCADALVPRSPPGAGTLLLRPETCSLRTFRHLKLLLAPDNRIHLTSDRGGQIIEYFYRLHT